MGGNALKNTTVRRLARAEYLDVAGVVQRRLRSAFPDARVEVIPSYGAKHDFGDLDVLVTSEPVTAVGGSGALRSLATSVFHATEVVKNGNVTSFDYRGSSGQSEPGFQIDVITQPTASFDFALGYFSYNDLGNLIGRTAHKQGLSFGHDGLWYHFRDGDYKFREILLTLDFDHALRHLGYKSERFRQGFVELTDIFEYVSGSGYFNRDIFLLDNRNAQARVRDKKRKTYMEFLDWCEGRPHLPVFTYPASKSAWLPHLFAAFPGFKGEYEQSARDLARLRAVKERFNGDLVREWTGLSDQALGGVMQRFREQFITQDALVEHVLSSNEDALRAEVHELAKTARPVTPKPTKP